MTLGRKPTREEQGTVWVKWWALTRPFHILRVYSDGYCLLHPIDDRMDLPFDMPIVHKSQFKPAPDGK